MHKVFFDDNIRDSHCLSKVKTNERILMMDKVGVKTWIIGLTIRPNYGVWI